MIRWAFLALIVLLLIHPAQFAAAVLDNTQEQAAIQLFETDNDADAIVTALDVSDDSFDEEDEELLLQGRITLATTKKPASKKKPSPKPSSKKKPSPKPSPKKKSSPSPKKKSPKPPVPRPRPSPSPADYSDIPQDYSPPPRAPKSSPPPPQLPPTPPASPVVPVVPSMPPPPPIIRVNNCNPAGVMPGRRKIISGSRITPNGGLRPCSGPLAVSPSDCCNKCFGNSTCVAWMFSNPFDCRGQGQPNPVGTCYLLSDYTGSYDPEVPSIQYYSGTWN